jgi:hypothetical protein
MEIGMEMQIQIDIHVIIVIRLQFHLSYLLSLLSFALIVFGFNSLQNHHCYVALDLHFHFCFRFPPEFRRAGGNQIGCPFKIAKHIVDEVVSPDIQIIGSYTFTRTSYLVQVIATENYEWKIPISNR